MNQGTIWTFGPFRLEPGNATLLRNHEPVALRPRSFSVLCRLAGRSGELVTKEQLLEEIWPTRYVTEGVLKVCINEIRRVLGDDPKAPRYVETVARRGYRFIAAVSATETSHRIHFDGSKSGPTDTKERQDRYWVGRGPLLERLCFALQQVEQGERRTMFVSGDPGSGKTTLVRMFLDRVADRQPTILHCRCVERFGTDEAFLPVIEALVKRCRGADGEALKALLFRHAPTWLAQMPWVLNSAEQEALRRDVLGATRQRMLLEICEAIERLSEQKPLVLVLDDIQWSDCATLDFLGLLARRRDRAKLLVVATYRPGDVADGESPLKPLKHELQSHGFGVEMAVGALSAREVNDYLTLRFPGCRLPEILTDVIYRRSGGHPFFMVSLVGYFLERGRYWMFAAGKSQLEHAVPDNVRLTIERQIDRLTQGEQRVLEAASVVGSEFPAALLAEVLGLERLEIEMCCENLARRGQLLGLPGMEDWHDGTPTGRFALPHALYQEVLYQRLAPAWRARLHQRIGACLETAQGEPRAGLAAVLALHFEQARDHPRAVHHLRQAADDSARRFANLEAISYLNRAIAMIKRRPTAARTGAEIDFLRRRAEARRSLGDMPGAAEDLAALLACSREAGNLGAEISALADLSRVYVWLDRHHCLQLADEAVDRSLNLGDEAVQTLVRGLRGSWNLYLTGWRDVHAAACTQALAVARRVGDPRLLCSHLAFQAMLEIFRSEYGAANAVALEGMRWAEPAGDGYLFMVCQYYRLWALLHGGVWGEMQQALESALATAEKNGNRCGIRISLLMKTWLQAEAGRTPQAQASCDKAGGLMAENPDPVSRCLYPIVTARVHLETGDASNALQYLEPLSTAIDADGLLMDWNFFLPFHRIVAEASLALGDLAHATVHAEALCRKAYLAPERTYLALGHRLRAEIALAEGDWGTAEAESAKAVAIVESVECPLAAWRVHETAVRIQRRHNADLAERHASRAREMARRMAASLGEVDDLS